MKQQTILLGSGVLLLASLFFFGRTTADKKPVGPAPISTAKSFNITEFIKESKNQLSAGQRSALAALDSRSPDDSSRKKQYELLAEFWKDSARLFEPYAYYLSEASKLDNSKKSLTFAAQLILHNLRGEEDEAKVNWESETAIDLFERAIKLDPQDDDLRVGLGSVYVFGRGRFGSPEETMKGVSQLLEVVRRDSMNMKAQLVLGVGSFISRQYDKGIVRLLKVVEAEPGNLEAVAFLADSYAAKGDKTQAVKWYQLSKRMANNAHYSQEVDERIKALK